MSRTNYSSGSKWEHVIGYSRAVKVGNIIEVTGTVASGDDGKVVGKDDAYLQTKFIYQKIEEVLIAIESSEHESIGKIISEDLPQIRLFPVAC